MIFLCIVVAAVAAPASAASAQAVFRNTYHLLILQAPDGLIQHGIRNYIVGAGRARCIVGSVRRAWNEQNGQYLIVNATGTLQDLNELEDELFAANSY